MGNILAFLLGLVSLAIVIPATMPFLGWANWLALPLIVTGAIASALPSPSVTAIIEPRSSANR